VYVSTLQENQLDNYNEVFRLLSSEDGVKVNQNIFREPLTKIETLDDFLQPGVLSDAFTEYLDKLLECDEETVSSDESNPSYREADLTFYQNIVAESSITVNEQIFPIPYGSDTLPVAKYLAKLFAPKRVEALKNLDQSQEKSQEQADIKPPPVPVYIAASALRGKSLEAALIDSVLDVDSNVFQQAIRNAPKTRDGLVLILHGFDEDTDPFDFGTDGFIPQLKAESGAGRYRLVLIATHIHQLMAWKEYLN
jgi:hypothetical protein